MKKKISKKDILQLMKIDHDMLREAIEVFKNEHAFPSEKTRQLERFLFNLKVHSEAEEVSFYDSMVGLLKLRAKILEGYEEHNLANHLMIELKAMNFKNFWSEEVDAKAKVLAELIEHHLNEEESKLFPVVKANMTKTELENLGVIYLQTRKEKRRELENRFTLPSIESVTVAVQESFKGTFGRVSSFVSSQFSASR